MKYCSPTILTANLDLRGPTFDANADIHATFPLSGWAFVCARWTVFTIHLRQNSGRRGVSDLGSNFGPSQSLTLNEGTAARFAVGGKAIVTTLPKRMHTVERGRREKEGLRADGGWLWHGMAKASNARP